MIQIPYGNDFSLRYIVTTINYVEEETIVENYDLTQAQNVSVFLHCDKHDINIPLQWHIEDNTNNVIIADVVGSQLEVGSVYGTFITGQDDNNKNWRWSESGQNMFSVVEYTGNEDLGEYEDLQNIDVKVGLVGLNGHQGEQGVQGSQGEIGMQGSQGRKGDDGAQGVQGQRGEKGYQGEAGVQGIQGRKGDTGFQGEIGEKGVQGDTGFQGVIGEQGSQGSQGDTGVQGTAGIGFRLGEDNQFYVDNHVHVTNGDSLRFTNEEHPLEDPSGSILFASKEMGLSYPQVAINTKGLDDSNGNIYANDYYYYEEIGGSTKSIRNRIDNLRTRVSALEESGVQGPQGDKGADGYQGIDGQQGPQGRKGDDGAQGVQGQRGEKGYQGEAGVQGIQGRKGDIGVQGSQGSKGADGTMYFDDLTPEQKASLKGDQCVQGVKGSQGDRGPQGYGAASPAAELPRVALWDAGVISGTGVFNVYMSIADNTTVYDDLYTYLYNKFNITDTIDRDFRPTSLILSSNNNYTLEIHGDFDKMHLTIDNRQFTITKANDTQTLPTWLSISIRARASLFNLQNQIVGDDEVCILGMTYINLSDANWNVISGN